MQVNVKIDQTTDRAILVMFQSDSFLDEKFLTLIKEGLCRGDSIISFHVETETLLAGSEATEEMTYHLRNLNTEDT